MSYYFIANISIHDPKEYSLYIKDAEKVFRKYNGQYLAVDDHPKVVEGTWNYGRAVIISFQRQADFDAWYNSDDYQQILKHRLSAATCDTIVVQGLEE